jgi:hypothetical protein
MYCWGNPVQTVRIMAISARLSSAASPPGQPPISKTVRGMVIDHGHGLMVLQTELGGEWVLEELEDDPLPRIC